MRAVAGRWHTAHGREWNLAAIVKVQRGRVIGLPANDRVELWERFQPSLLSKGIDR